LIGDEGTATCEGDRVGPAADLYCRERFAQFNINHTDVITLNVSGVGALAGGIDGHAERPLSDGHGLDHAQRGRIDKRNLVAVAVSCEHQPAIRGHGNARRGFSDRNMGGDRQ